MILDINLGHSCAHSYASMHEYIHTTYTYMENPKLNLYVPLKERGLAIMRNYLMEGGVLNKLLQEAIS